MEYELTDRKRGEIELTIKKPLCFQLLLQKKKKNAYLANGKPVFFRKLGSISKQEKNTMIGFLKLKTGLQIKWQKGRIGYETKRELYYICSYTTCRFI